MAAQRDSAAADRVTVSYRAPDADPAGDESGFGTDHLVHERIRDSPFLTYLRRVHGRDVAVGDEWTEFVNCGCGTTTDVALRVESVEGGTALGEDTDLELAPLGAVAGPTE